MRPSLFVKLLIAFGLVVLVSTGLMAFLANRAASGGLTLFIDQTAERRAGQLAPVFSSYYSITGSWEEVDQFLLQTPRVPRGIQRRLGLNPDAPISLVNWWLPDHRLVLIDAHGTIVFDSQEELTGKIAGEDLLSPSVPIIVEARQVGALLIAQRIEAAPHEQFLDRVNQWLLWAGLGSGALALVIAALFTRQITAPVRRLTAAARGISAGNLSQRVEVSGQDELGSLGSAFNDMARKLELNEQQRRQVVADIAHELRNPLSTMQGKLEGIMDGVLPLDQSQVATVYDQTMLLSRLVEDLRLLSLAQSGQLPLEKTLTNIGSLARRIVDNFQPQAKDRGVALKADCADRDMETAIDPHRISQVLANLLSNALRYTPERGEVTVAVSKSDGVIQVSVADTGIGIKPEELPHVFERFYRVEKSRSRDQGGSGLGLAIAKEVVQAHGGRIWAESLPGRGSTFTFTLPPPKGR